MFSPTLRCGNRASDWNTMPKLRLCVGTPVMSSPSSAIVPEDGSSNPAIILSSVVLPQPDGPSRQTKVPCGTERLRLSTAVKLPKCLVMSLIVNPGIHIPLSCLDAGIAGSPEYRRWQGVAAPSSLTVAGPRMAEASERCALADTPACPSSGHSHDPPRQRAEENGNSHPAIISVHFWFSQSDLDV